MAKAKDEGISKSQIFRRYFDKRPDLLRESSFDDVIAMYKQEFPDRDFTDNDRQIAANIKSRMRKERKISRRRRRPGAPTPGASSARCRSSTPTPAVPSTTGRRWNCWSPPSCRLNAPTRA